jgi:hypothetical protein
MFRETRNDNNSICALSDTNSCFPLRLRCFSSRKKFTSCSHWLAPLFPPAEVSLLLLVPTSNPTTQSECAKSSLSYLRKHPHYLLKGSWAREGDTATRCVLQVLTGDSVADQDLQRPRVPQIFRWARRAGPGSLRRKRRGGITGCNYSVSG